MVSLAVLRKQRATRLFLKEAWARAKAAEANVGKLCAHCSRPMAEVEVPFGIGESDLAIDVCTLCMGIWFDPGEHDELALEASELPEDAESSELSPAAKKALAVMEVQHIAERAEEERASEGPEDAWQYVPALFGLPIETSVPEIRDRPLLTWGLTALCSMVFVILVLNDSLSVAIGGWGFIPAEAMRNGGLTLLTSFIVHGGILHILGNMYFLMVFGDNVEDDLGAWGFVVLVFGAHFAGILGHALIDPRGDVPLVGASAGISGVIAYYAVAFPRARLGFVIWIGYGVRWVRMPAVVAFVFWILLQVCGAYQQVAGISNVSSAAHLGGAAVGLITAFCVRLQRRRVLGNGVEAVSGDAGDTE